MRKAAQLPEQIQDNQPLQSDSISAALWNLDVTMCSIGKEQYSQSLIHGEHHALLQMPFDSAKMEPKLLLRRTKQMYQPASKTNRFRSATCCLDKQLAILKPCQGFMANIRN